MPSVNSLLKVLLMWICLVTTLSATREEAAQDFIEHVLKIPNPDRVLNSVLGRLERNRQGLLERAKPRFAADEDCEDPENLPEYTETLQESVERGLRHLGSQTGPVSQHMLRPTQGPVPVPRDPMSVHQAIITTNSMKLNKGRNVNGGKSPFYIIIKKHYPICHLERKIHRLNTNEYEYRPAYYEEVRCTMTPGDDAGVTNEVCSSLGFSCVQWNKTIHLTRRRYSSDCWETKTMVIPAGCECMWPVHRLGQLTLHA